MATYKLNPMGTFAQMFEDNIATGDWANTQTNEAYLAWLAEGNVPTPADQPTE
jgi:hypothetical protein